MQTINNLQSVISKLKQLDDLSIEIPLEIESLALLLEQLTRKHHESNTQKIKDIQRQREIESNQKKLNEAVSGILQDMWLFFWMGQLEKIYEYHNNIKSGWDDSGYDRKQDVKAKFLAIHQLLLEEWNFPFPPFSQVQLYDSKMVKRMIYSSKYAHKCYADDGIPCEYGYTYPPILTKSILEYTIESYITFRRKNYSYDEWNRNEILNQIFNSYYYEDRPDLYQLVLEKYGFKTYKELCEKSCLKNFINFEPDSPNLEYNKSYNITDLLSYEWDGSDNEEEEED